ncbi:MAG: SDR family oxidoreductase [Candidatus Accumulibacter sp.]|nr:SDR family oxidoreductase [Accumulibacter sp.]
MQTLLIVGCGDIARRVTSRLLGRYRIFALLREAEDSAFWRALGVRPIFGNLDFASSLKRFHGIADDVLYFAPPQNFGVTDKRARRLIAALSRGRKRVRRLVYVSTCGVYGNAGGAWIDETARLSPRTDRARRRVDAERRLRRFGRDNGVCASILRAPGIYASDRLPIDRLKEGIPALFAEDDVYTNHIHAEDLAAIVCAALRRGRPNRCYNAADDSEMKMGDYYDIVADRFGLPRAPRVSREEAPRILSPARLSFMRESRRIDNTRIKTELRIRLRFPYVADGIEAAWRETRDGEEAPGPEEMPAP